MPYGLSWIKSPVPADVMILSRDLSSFKDKDKKTFRNLSRMSVAFLMVMVRVKRQRHPKISPGVCPRNPRC